MKFGAVALAVILGSLVGYILADTTLAKNDIIRSAVAITSMDGRRGGTGIILESKNGESRILTNSHVCGLVEHGALVHSVNGSFMVKTYKHADNHDLCLLTVEANLHINTDIAKEGPVPYYDQASISGHPALFPTVVTKGHVSGDKIIQVMSGMRKCTDEEKQGPNGLLCILLGGIPNIKTFSSTLVSATIMPGSSGSGVYNSKNELIGVVFAGQGELAYAFTVPYDAMIAFLESEASQEFKKVTSLKEGAAEDEQQKIEEGIQKIKEVCADPAKRAKLGGFCKKVTTDLLYREE